MRWHPRTELMKQSECQSAVCHVNWKNKTWEGSWHQQVNQPDTHRKSFAVPVGHTIWCWWSHAEVLRVGCAPVESHGAVEAHGTWKVQWCIQHRNQEKIEDTSYISLSLPKFSHEFWLATMLPVKPHMKSVCLTVKGTCPWELLTCATFEAVQLTWI